MVSSRRRALRTPPRQTRAKPTISYAESSDDGSDSFEEASDDEIDIPSPPQRQNPRPQRNQPPTKQSKPPNKRRAKSSNHNRTSKRRRQNSAAVQKSTDVAVIPHIVGSGVIPKWQTLPYHVLIQIFRFASYPLYDDHTFQPLPSVKQLLGIGRLCTDFAEPALTVLYESPPLVPMAAAHMLVDLLKQSPATLGYKYRQKVESLHIEVEQVAAYSLSGSGHLDLYGLIKDLPRLVDLEFYHQKDLAPYRTLESKIRWKYPKAIFDALGHVDPAAEQERGDKTSICKLNSWRWSSRLAGAEWALEKLAEVHLKPCFQSLRKIAFVNYQVSQVKTVAEDEDEEPKDQVHLADAIKALPSLEHLVFESSTLVDAKLLTLLPKSLRKLQLINCWEVQSDDFAGFLLTHGHHLRCLILDHNQSLSLGFLTVLENACPNLQTLRMNLVYYNIHASYRNTEPMYEHLLLLDQVPTWPSTLQTLELLQLRKWETEAAEMFFQSLLNSAGSLPHLRTLHIQAIIDIPWRDRASFRDKWIGSIDRVFKRVTLPPRVHQTVRPTMITSPVVEIPVKPLVAPTKRLSRISIASASSSSAGSTDEPPSPRRSTRARRTEATYAESSDDEDQDDKPLAIVRKRPQKLGRLTRELNILKATAGQNGLARATPPQTTSESEDANGANKFQGKGKQPEVIQGMCERVEVRIDNLRPTEHQATEADFMNSEQSGDEDWNGNDGLEDGYAW